MAALASPASISATLTQWLRLLWDVAPPLALDSDAPHIAAGAIHLPARKHWRHHAAAAAHATAHLVYSPPCFDGAGLGGIARALVALLEDARVEALAMRELPGLARLWRPLHNATAATGSGFEALMQRLARALVDPDYDDPSPWVEKGRALFFLGGGQRLLALRSPAEVCRAAVLLGHDIGQMRLQFNAKMYRPAPAYRDDHRWMWAADVLQAAPPPAAAEIGSAIDDDDAWPDATGSVTLHPEWDRLISRLRPDWCRVVEPKVPLRAADSAVVDEGVRETARRLAAPLRGLVPQSTAARREDEGEVFDPAALVDWRIARRMRSPGDVRVYRGLERRSAGGAVCLLIDQSASAAAAHGAAGDSVLQTAARSAAAAAAALQHLGVPCAVVGFSSRGRHAVSLQTLKAFDALADAPMLARLQALRAGGSTRLGAALRHATRRLTERHAEPRWLILLSDGEPHDVDVHDPRYLVEDARQAVRSAARGAVRMACLVLAAQRGTDPQRIFGRQNVHVLPGLESLPRVMHKLLRS